MLRACVMLGRLCLTAWVGAAVLFVSVTILPIRQPWLETEQKARLAGLLFPGYYGYAFSLLGLALLLGLAALNHAVGRHLIYRLHLILVGLALAMVLVDWFWVYGPLAEMTARQVQDHAAPPSDFRGYHLASMVVNSVTLGLSLLAACLANWPLEERNVAKTV